MQQVQTPDLAMLESSENQLGKIYQLFKKYATHNLQDKSVNGQNCRKSSQLSIMLLVHKIMIRNPSEIEKKIYAGLLSTYVSMFREVASLIFDLGPFLFYIKGTKAATDLI